MLSAAEASFYLLPAGHIASLFFLKIIRRALDSRAIDVGWALAYLSRVVKPLDGRLTVEYSLSACLHALGEHVLWP